MADDPEDKPSDLNFPRLTDPETGELLPVPIDLTEFITGVPIVCSGNDAACGELGDIPGLKPLEPITFVISFDPPRLRCARCACAFDPAPEGVAFIEHLSGLELPICNPCAVYLMERGW